LFLKGETDILKNSFLKKTMVNRNLPHAEKEQIVMNTTEQPSQL